MAGKDVLAKIGNMTKEEMEDVVRRLTGQLDQMHQNAAQTDQNAAQTLPKLNETIPQSNPLQYQVQNQHGGYSYEIDNLTRLKRYLILGSSHSNYKSTKKPDVLSTIPVVHDMIEADEGTVVIDTVLKLSREAQISREEHFLIVLRDCIMYKGERYYDKEKTITIQRAAYNSIVKVCNIPTKLFRFLDLCNPFFEKQWKPSENEVNSKTQIKKRKRAEEKALANQHAQKMATETCEVVKEPQTGEPPKKKKKKKKKAAKKKKVATKPLRKYKRSSCWGRARKRGIASFYQDEKKDANRLLLLLTKYKSRHNWDHKQVLAYCHPKIDEKKDDEYEAKQIVLKYCTKGYNAIKHLIDDNTEESKRRNAKTSQVLDHIKALEEVKGLSPNENGHTQILLKLLTKYGQRDAREEFTISNSGHVEQVNTGTKKCSFQLVREHLPNAFLKIKEVWVALLQDMPMTALIRNLGKMTNLGLFEDQANVKLVVDALGNADRIAKARIHPIKLLLAGKMYEQGHGDDSNLARVNDDKKDGKEPLKWTPVSEISKALNSAFYLSFTQPGDNSSFRTGKKFFLALDVSGSMNWSPCEGCPFLTPAVASFAMAMVTMNIEENCGVYAFGSELQPIGDKIKKEMTIQQALSAGQKVSFGRTDCAAPMMYAIKNRLDVDVFIVYTDSETWCGKIHPSEALKKYRAEMNKPDAKLIVMAMQVNDFSIADPKDKGMLDVCGFDSEVPKIVNEFALGNLS